MSRRGPLTPEEREWAAKHGRGAGAAAVLLFLHVVLVGYLLCILWFLVAMMFGREMVPTLQWSWQVFLPAWVAVLTYIPTDKLTRSVARVAAATGVVVLLAATAAWFLAASGGFGSMTWYIFILAGTMAAAAMLRLAFTAVIDPAEARKMAKGDAENTKSE